MNRLYAKAEPGQFLEYPKAVEVAGRVVACLNEEEERQALEKGAVVREEDERARMLAVAKMYGLAIDGRWKLERIAAAIANAGYDPELDPGK